MKTPLAHLPVIGGLLIVTSQASAHGGDEHAASVYHYLSSPDHVLVFGLAAIVVIGTILWRVRGSLRAARQTRR